MGKHYRHTLLTLYWHTISKTAYWQTLLVRGRRFTDMPKKSNREFFFNSPYLIISFAIDPPHDDDQVSNQSDHADNPDTHAQYGI